MLANYSNVSLVPYTEKLPARLYWTADSGRIVYRKKINTLIGIDHPAIILGEDGEGYLWVVHHHYRNTYPTVDRIDTFSLGENIFYDLREVCYDRYTIVERAIQHWMEAKEYNWLWQNCQHFVNGIACDNHQSEGVNDAANKGLIFSGILGLLGLATGNKAMVNIAIGTAVVSGAVKTLNYVRVTPALPAARNLRILR